MKEALDYAIQIASSYLSFLPGGAAYMKGKRVLELGPGRDFGPALVFVGYGAEVTLADKYLAEWDPSYHPAFYSALREMLPTKYPGLNLAPFDQAIQTRSHSVKGLSLFRTGLEDLQQVPTASMDLTLSNAVFEHLYDGKKACAQLGRVTRSGGLGFHQIDFRWHRDFSHPLEYITLSDDQFAQIFESCHGECGNRLRYTEFKQFFESSGFIINQIEKNMYADEAYLSDAIARAQPRYKAMERESLQVLGGRFYLTRK